MASETYKFAIIGMGPVGGILAAHLARKGHEIYAVDVMADHLDAIRRSGLEISGFEETRATIPRTFNCLAELEGIDVDYICIALKTSVLGRMIGQIRGLFRPGMKVVACQNGIGNEEFLASHLGPENVIRVVINYAGNYLGPGRIRMTFFNGPNWIGALTPELFPDCRMMADLWTEAGLETEFAEDMRQHTWEKSILNAAMSPIAAVTGLTMKAIMDTPYMRQLVEKTLREAIDVARAGGITIRDGFYDHSIGYLEKAGHHKTSMLVDIETNRPTEIGFLNEKICQCGKGCGMETPYNLILSNLVRGIELQKGIIPAEVGNG